MVRRPEPTARKSSGATSRAGTNPRVYKSDEELFGEVMQETGLQAHPRYMNLSACISTMLSLKVGVLDGMTHEEVLVLAAKFGFRFETHEEARLVVEAVERFYEKRRAFDDKARRAPFRNFDAHIFRDRNGRLMATFSIGTTTFRPVVLDETWERKFASVYQETLVAALAMTEGEDHGVHDPEDGDSAGSGDG